MSYSDKTSQKFKKSVVMRGGDTKRKQGKKSQDAADAVCPKDTEKTITEEIDFCSCLLLWVMFPET